LRSAVSCRRAFVSSQLTNRLSLLTSNQRSTGCVANDSFGRVGTPSDEMLMARVCSGDREALGGLFERYALLLRGVAVRILRDTSEAEDLAQDLFLFIQRKCAMFDSSKSSARSWIIQMTYHRAIERRRYLTTRQFYSHSGAEGVGNRVVGTPAREADYS